MDEAAANAAKWDFVDYAPALKSRPTLILTADDGLTPDNQRLAAALKAAGDSDATEEHMTTDHSYSDHRIALESTIVRSMRQRRRAVSDGERFRSFPITINPWNDASRPPKVCAKSLVLRISSSRAYPVNADTPYM